jgi:hypothetical protein
MSLGINPLSKLDSRRAPVIPRGAAVINPVLCFAVKDGDAVGVQFNRDESITRNGLDQLAVF